MRRIALRTLVGLCTAALVGGSATAASAADQDAATGVTASVSDGSIRVAWTHSPDALSRQAIAVSVLGRASSGVGGSDVDAAATDGSVVLEDSSDLLGGHTYSVWVVSTPRGDGYVAPLWSDPVTVTLPEVPAERPEKEPSCRIDAKAKRLTVRVPAADEEDETGTHTVTGRSVQLTVNGTAVTPLTVPGAAAGSITAALDWTPVHGKHWGTEVEATYTVDSAAGSSAPSPACSAVLGSPAPHDFVSRGTLKDGVASLTWRTPRSPESPIAKYRLSWQLDSKKPHSRTVGPDAVHRFAVRIGHAKRVRLDVYAYNRLNRWTWSGELWNKRGGVWDQGGGR